MLEEMHVKMLDELHVESTNLSSSAVVKLFTALSEGNKLRILYGLAAMT